MNESISCTILRPIAEHYECVGHVRFLVEDIDFVSAFDDRLNARVFLKPPFSIAEDYVVVSDLLLSDLKKMEGVGVQ